MTTFRILLLLLLAQTGLGQSNVFCVRPISHLPNYERIFMAKGTVMRQGTLHGIDDLRPAQLFPGTNRIDGVFADPSRERTNGFYTSCLAEIPMENLELGNRDGVLSLQDVRELLRHTLAVPRDRWTYHMNHNLGERYVFSLVGKNTGDYVIDEREGSCALIYFPDGTYRCLMDPNYSCLKAPKDGTSAKGIGSPGPQRN